MLRKFPPFITMVALLASLACQSTPAPFNPDDPAVIATIDSLLKGAMEGSATANADKVLAMAEGGTDFTFITGDVLLSGLQPIKEAFRTTYAGLKRQDQVVSEMKVRLLSPDVALLTVVGEGTYTDLAGWTSPPVGIGMTIVFVREGGQWRARHAHQSIAF
jgi:uncharacterized protein (TIGR02246 family)